MPGSYAGRLHKQLKAKGAQEYLILPAWAAELGALVISLEHRFFGLSNPSNASDHVEKYQSLTLENVMLDAVSVIEHIQNTIPGAKHSQVIVSGGSYGGFLTTVLRINHPETFFGALPLAAPLRSIGANYQNPGRYEWFKWVRTLAARHQNNAEPSTRSTRFTGTCLRLPPVRCSTPSKYWHDASRQVQTFPSHLKFN